jgi:hypothetical protein
MPDFVLEGILPDEYDFDRMKQNIAFIQNMDYPAFVAHNRNISDSLSKKEREFCIQFVDRLYRGVVRSLDMDTPCLREVNNLFFGEDGELVVVSPR